MSIMTDFDPPPGWGNKPEDLEYEDEWDADDSVGQWLCAELNLGIAGGKFYFWYCMDLAVSEIISPTNLDEIVKVMKDKGEEALKTKKILR